MDKWYKGKVLKDKIKNFENPSFVNVEFPSKQYVKIRNVSKFINYKKY